MGFISNMRVKVLAAFLTMLSVGVVSIVGAATDTFPTQYQWAVPFAAAFATWAAAWLKKEAAAVDENPTLPHDQEVATDA